MNDTGISLEKQRVVVIGGTSGIGFAIAKLAQSIGAEVVVASSSAANVEAARKRLPGVEGDVVDLRHEEDVSRFFDKIGPFDHLAVTAGDWDIPLRVATQDIDLVASRDMLAVRFWGVIAAVKHGIGAIREQGSITLTSGMIAHRPMKNMPLAAAMAGAVEFLARGLAVDLAPLRVNVVCAGLILTEHFQSVPQERLQAIVARLPLPRAATPEEAAMAYVYAMVNRYVTGQVLPVDGGGNLL
jgi:NAD(P)-dependent dehydrogenase (short-subunit alcohol dehydrogenase family)